MYASQLPTQDEPNHLLMMVGYRLYGALCKQYNAAVVQYELDAASNDEHDYIQEFIKELA